MGEVKERQELLTEARPILNFINAACFTKSTELHNYLSICRTGALEWTKSKEIFLL